MMDDEKAHFRKVLGHYPTGVCAITAKTPDGTATAMIVGSFTSVSLDPPLVGFFPDKQSSSWSAISVCDGFCVNVLGSSQEALCRQLASKDPRKFEGVAHTLSPRGAPLIDGALAWIDCSMHSVSEAGDHLLVLGAVESFEIATPGDPLLFHKGSYGKFTA
ncbi:flavin reductase-like, FMN-binding protein [Novosphingobium aromaticivorans DSM 12444]|uniref:Flavin reductase-like, FMN-binding protein n=1 Tax=Novosphingobium aromaticivorans (strain ATCC 700278 / DSM 12444 / CCUG 56034 / CIP 105152 / NBRC 16084 / F199) TaxID=279238 RepID=Q2GB11_NOVAD|nr:flavin reductase family protein [Novosphingobium aromaticivorans]ABD24962.1 flavin reductase-like, FMN-binding protein [Novosphingobium aromaticivorans DSM 12444]SCY86251.1 NADH-FMN oxidoreductase RutF, flavin reductase (DIM6/NTAB) family [Novosphingobium aromaticivorans]